MSKQHKVRGNRAKTGTSRIRVSASSKVAHHSASSSKPRFAPRAGILTFVGARRRTHQSKVSMDETSALDTELNTATDSVNDEAAATSTSMLDPAATDNSSNAGDAQAASGAAMPMTAVPMPKIPISKTPAQSHQQRQRNHPKRPTSRQQKEVQATATTKPNQSPACPLQPMHQSQRRTYSDLQIRTTPDFGCGCAPQAMEEAPEVPVYVVCRSDGAD